MNRRHILKLMAALPMMPAAFKDAPAPMLPPIEEVARMPLREHSTNTSGLREDMVGSIDGVPAYFTELSITSGTVAGLGGLNREVRFNGPVSIDLTAKVFGPGAAKVLEKVKAHTYGGRLCEWEMGTGVVGDIQRKGTAYAMSSELTADHGTIITLHSTQRYKQITLT